MFDSYVRQRPQRVGGEAPWTAAGNRGGSTIINRWVRPCTARWSIVRVMVPRLFPRHLVVLAWLALGAACSPPQADSPTQGPGGPVVAAEYDARISAAVRAIYRGNPFLRDANIQVDTVSGIVTLASDDTSKPQREFAVLLAHEVTRVVGVVDRMK